MSYDYDLVIEIGSPPQFFGVQNFVKELIKRSDIKFICLVPVVEDRHSREMFNQVYKLVESAGFEVTRKAPKSCKVLLAAWPRENIKYKYVLRYTYSLLTAKPNPVYLPDSQRRYHGILTQNIFEYETLKVYANTYFVPNLKYIGWKKEKTSGKAVLFLPTWNAAALGEIGNINVGEDIIPALKELKENGYHVIVKAHPITLSDPATRHYEENIKKIADEYFDANTGIQDVLAKADLVISDNSGAIYEALYSHIPVVVYGDRTNVRHLGSIDTAHYRWIKQGVIENPNSPEELLSAIEKGLKKDYLKKQQEIADKTFKRVYDNSAVDAWMEVIDKYLRDEVSQDYIELHNYYMDFIDGKDQRVQQLLNEMHQKNNELNELVSQFNNEQNPGIRTATKRLAKALVYKLGIIKREA